jgi:SHS2 domain-containing protein
VKSKPYELIEHTADIGIIVKGKNLKELFRNAALAMFDISAQSPEKRVAKALGVQTTTLRPEQRTEKIELRLKSEDLEELFINWLNELLSVSATKELVFTDLRIKKLDENNLEAEVLGEDIKNYRINTEIKAATYHELEIEKTEASWKAKVIFDV